MTYRYVRGRSRKQRVQVLAEYVNARIPRRLFVLLVAVISFGILVPLQGKAYLQLLSAIMLMGLVVWMVSLLISMRTPSAGVAKIGRSGPLRFPCPQGPRLGALFGSLCCVLYGILSIYSVPLVGVVVIDGAKDSVTAYGIFLGGLLGLGYVIRCGFTPFGIELNSRGVRWQHWGSKKEVAWEDLGKVELGLLKRSRSIHLCGRGGGATSFIDISTMGSDPVIIAETIAYFLRYPKERETLNDPVAALSLVMDLSEPTESRA